MFTAASHAQAQPTTCTIYSRRLQRLPHEQSTRQLRAARLFHRAIRPVKAHPHEKALGGHFFDPNAVRFFVSMATADAVSPEVVWTVVPPTANGEPYRVVSGQREQVALGFIICQLPFAVGENIEFTVCRRLSYRARIRIATLQGLLDDIRQDGQLTDGSMITASIQHRIEGLKA